VNLVVTSRPDLSPAHRQVEIVERKGLGHPDTICDALSEEVSRALCRYYLERFGRVLHHSVDKVLLVGGSSEPRYGGGDIVRPMEIVIAGRATAESEGATIPVADLAEHTCLSWIRAHLREDVAQHVHITPLIRPGSGDLRALFGRGPQKALANDTSCGAGFAPLSNLERLVLAVEQSLNSAATKARQPAIGEDIKVMAVRHRERVTLTIACAMVDRHIRDATDYSVAKAQVQDIAHETGQAVGPFDLDVVVNAADNEAGGVRYMTVSGTSAEAGDDGETGRGNRASGLITPYRAMTMEAAAGKNPVTHVGKLYQLMSADLAARLVSELPDTRAAECLLVSQIGRPVSDPFLVDIAIGEERDDSHTRQRIEQLTDDVLHGVAALTDDLIHGRRQLY
jgi:S-adenosylmethionine synthetase